jgi:hypothetical protein
MVITLHDEVNFQKSANTANCRSITCEGVGRCVRVGVVVLSEGKNAVLCQFLVWE